MRYVGRMLVGGAAMAMACSASARNVIPIDDAVFAAPPAAAVADPAGPCRVAQQYVDHINGKRIDKVATLFAAQATFVTPVGRTLHGRKGIDEFYGALLAKRPAHIIPLSFIASGQECVMELATRTPPETNYQLSAIDHFTVDASGLIERMVVYVQPQAALAIKEAGLDNWKPTE